LKTPPRHFIVKPVPEKLKGENWLVAKNVFIKEHWNKSLHNLKVGDVIERTVTIDAKGTLPQFIPSLHHASLSFASEYLQDAELDDERNEYDANGRLTQSVIYLLEKEGDFVIPAVEIQWWNPLNSKLFKRTAASAKIHVQPNPNLGMMASIKDSLAATQTIKTTVTPHKGPLRIAGIAWYWFMVYLLAALALLYMIARFSLQVYTTLKARRMAYLQSDRYWFRQLQANSKLNAAFVDNMYRWWDRIRFPGKLPTISVTWKNNKEDVLNNEWAALTRSLYSAQQEPGDDITVFKKHLAQYQKTSKRISPLFTNELISETQLPWGNNKQTKNTSV
jgi:hypothetical protein